MKLYTPACLLLLLFSFAFDQSVQSPQQPPLADIHPNQKSCNATAVPLVHVENSSHAPASNIIFKSTDGGQTWDDISEGLPESMLGDGFQAEGFVVNDEGLYVRAGNEVYHSKPNSTAPFWKKEPFPGKYSSIAPGDARIFAFNWEGQFSQKINGTSVWTPVYANFQKGEIRSVFESVGGTFFIGCNNGLYKSTDSGKTWKQVHDKGWVIKIVESDGVLMATSQGGIIRSTNDGENWDCVIYEGGVGIDIAPIKDGFAAITYNTESETRRVRTSYDGGKTWQAIDAGLPGDQRTASIIQVGENFFCGHPAGIYRSADKGKTWKLIRPSSGDKVFHLFGSGNIIYAIPRSGEC